MGLKQDYDALLTENKQLFDDRDYQGYLEKGSKQTTSDVFLRIGEGLAHLRERLEKRASIIAQEHSLSTFNLFNEMIENLNRISSQFLQESEYSFYLIPEVHLRGCIEILQSDRDLIQRSSEFQTKAGRILNKAEITEQDIQELEKRCRNLLEAATNRQQRIQELGDKFRHLEEAAGRIGKLIDERDLNEARHIAGTLFEQKNGFLKPFLDLIEQFKDRKLFHTRRVESGMYRDEQSLKFFDLYVDVLSHLNQILDEQAENLELSPFKDKASQAAAKLTALEDQRKELYEQAAPRESEEEGQRDVDESAWSKIPLIAITALIILVITVIIVLVL